MENALKGLYMAAGITITCMIIGFGFLTAREAKNAAAASAEQLSGYRNSLAESRLVSYENATISGSELVNLMRFLLGQSSRDGLQFIEVVQTNRCRYEERDEISVTTDKTSQAYIDPFAAYECKLEREHGGGIVGMIFTKQ